MVLLQGDCLFTLHLFGLANFYLVPSSATYFSIISCCLTDCISSFLSADCSVIVPLASGVCPLMGEIGSLASAGFLVRGNGACPLVCRAEFFSSVCPPEKSLLILQVSFKCFMTHPDILMYFFHPSTISIHPPLCCCC